MLNFFSRWFSKQNKITSKSKKKTTRQATFLRHPQVELLEDRVTPAVFVYSGDTLFIEPVYENESLILTSEGGGNYTFKASDNFMGTNTTGLSGNGTTTLTITNALALNHIIIQDQNFSLNTNVLFGVSTGAYADNITINLDNEGSSLVTIGGATSFSGEASLNVAAVRNINVNAALSTVDGSITLDADNGTQRSGDFVGVDISANVTTTGNGSIIIQGRGGDNAIGNQVGVSINSGAKLQAGGTGTVSVRGAGGLTLLSGVPFGFNNYGVFVNGSGSAITSSGGNVKVEGLGGGGDYSNHGVFVRNGGGISAGGAGNVTVSGNGCLFAVLDNYGVYVDGKGSIITSSGGNVTVSGTGGGLLPIDGRFNVGVYVGNNGVISGGEAGVVTVTGIGGGGNIGSQRRENDGVSLQQGGAINSLGALILDGVAGSGDSRGLEIAAGSISTATNNTALTITTDTLIIDTGAGSINAGTGTVTLQNSTAGKAINLGTASTTSFGLSDAELDRITAGTLVIGRDDANASGLITVSSALSITPNLTLIGNGIAANANLTVPGSLTLTFSGAISGAGLLTAGQLQVGAKTGIQLNTAVGTFSSIANSTSGDITINQTGGISLPAISAPGNLSITATQGIVVSKAISAAGNILLDADNGSQQSGNFIGVVIGADVTTTNNGNITIEGRGGNDAFGGQDGVEITALTENGTVVKAGGTGKVSITGVGGSSSGSVNIGVDIRGQDGFNPLVTSSGGEVVIIGTGGEAGSLFNIGVAVRSSGSVQSGGTGSITVQGKGGGTGAGAGNNDGILVGSKGQISSQGALNLNGIQGAGNDGYDLNLGVSGKVSANNGSLLITADSLMIDTTGGSEATITSGTGTVTVQNRTQGITFTLGGSGASIDLSQAQLNQITAGTLVIGRDDNANRTGAITVSSAISRTGGLTLLGRDIAVNKDLTVAGNILLDADNGTQQTGNFIGVNITANVTTTNNGNITIEGRGGNDASGNQEGIHISGGADVLPNGLGTVVINGVGGASLGDGNDGVFMADTGTMVSSNGGSVTVSGTGGGTGNSSFSSGISVDGALIQSGGTGAVSVTGTGGGGAGVDSEVNSGILVYGQGEIKSQGTLAVTGTAGVGGFSTGVGLGRFFGSGVGSGTLSTTIAALTITTDNLFLGNVSTQEGFINAGTGTVTIRNKTVGTAINLGGIAAGISLTQAQLNRITAGAIIAGRADAGVETGTITIEAALTLAPSLEIIGPNGITLKNNVTTTGSQTYTGAITLGGNASLTSGVDLSFSSTVNGAFSLTTSSVGATTATGNIGDTTPLTSLIIAKSDGANFAGSVNTTTSVVIQDTTVSKAVVFQGALVTPTLTVNAGTAAYDVALNGSSTSITNAVQFDNIGSVSLGNHKDDILLFQGGLTSTATSSTFLAGSIRSSGNAMTLDGVSLTANTGLDTTNNGANPAGAVINLIDGADLNGFTLTLNSGATTNTVTGNVAITGGSLVSISDLSIGTAGTPAIVTASASTVIQAQGTLVVQTGSKIDSGTFPLTLRADTLSILSGPGSVIASKVTVAPATSDRAIFLGEATGTGLVVNQAAFEAMKTDQLTIGGDGYKGNIQMGTLTLGTSLEINADGPGGKVAITGAFKSNGIFKDFALKIKGSGNTTKISANITTDSDVFIDDAVEINAASVTIDTSSKNSKVTITGGTGGIFATKDQVNSLTINAGTGAIDLGSSAGLGDNGGTASLVNHVTLSGGSTNLNASANTIQGDFTLSAGTLSLGASGAIDAKGDILISSTDQVTLTGNTDLLAGGDIQLGGPIEGAFDLHLVADTGDILVSGTVGATTALKAVSVSDAKDVTFSGSIKAERLTQSAGTGATTINGAVTASASTGDAISITTRNIAIFSTGGLTTADGNIVLDADNGTQQTGSFLGVTLTGNVTTTGNGNITISGRGGDAAGGGLYGVVLGLGAKVQAGGTGTVAVTGTGGASSGNFNYGVNITGAGTVITSSGGDVTVAGTGGGIGDSGSNFGVFVFIGGAISAGGSGTVTVAGTGGASAGNNNYGVFVTGSNSAITSSGGNVTVAGTGGGSGASTENNGIRIQAGTINSLGTLKLTGTGGANSSLGLNLVSGTISTATNNTALTITTDTLDINTTDGTITAGTGTVTLQTLTKGATIDLGTSSTATFGLSDAELDRITAGTLVVGREDASAPGLITVSSALTITPNLTLISPLGIAVNATLEGSGNLTLDADNGSQQAGNFIGVNITQNVTTSGNGNITISGRGGNNEMGIQHGIIINIFKVQAGGSGTVMLTGTGGESSGFNNYGVFVAGNGAAITSSGGNVSVTGTGGGGGSSLLNFGVEVGPTGVISAGENGSVNVLGTGGNGSYLNPGVDVGGTITSSGGNVSVTGTGGGSGASTENDGIRIYLGGSISSLGALSLTGTSGINASLGLNLIGGTLSTGTNNTTLTITTDTIDINPTDGTITAGTGTVTLQTLVKGATIDLGTARTTTFGLSDAQLDRITAGTMIIGRQDAGFESGAITVSAYLTLTPSLQLIGPNGINLNDNVISNGLTLNGANTLNLQLLGDVVGFNYKQFVSNGTVTLTNSNLNLTIPSSFTPANGTEFILIANDGSDPVQGTFGNYVNNQLVTINGINYRFSYQGGDGNDVSLLRPALQQVATGAGFGTVQLTLFGRGTVATIVPFEGFLGEIRVASGGDFNNDGVFDFVVSAGPSGGPRVTIFDGVNGIVLANFFAYSTAFTGGVFASVADVTGDNIDDLITGAGAGGGPHVIIWDGTTLADPEPAITSQFFAYSQAFSGGVTVAAGDLDGDGNAEIITGAGSGGGPQVNIYASGSFQLLRSFFAYSAQFTGGVFVAVGELTGDSLADILTGAGFGGSSQVNVYDSRDFGLVQSFLAYSPGFTGGVRVGAADFTGDAIDDIITGAGPGGGPHVKVLEFDQTLLDQFFAGDADFTGGVFVS